MNIVKTLSVAVPLAVAAAILAATFGGPQKIGYIDSRRALNEVDEWKEAYGDLKRDFDAKQKTLDGKTEEIRKAQERLESGVLQDAKKAEQRRALEAQFMELRDLYMKLQAEISEREGAYKSGILDKMQDIVDELRINGGYMMILDKAAVLSGPRADDLTDKLVTSYNEQYRKNKGAAPKKK